MTDKERAWVQERLSEKDTLEVLALKLFRKELAKKLSKKGYAVTKEDFIVNKSPDCTVKGVCLDVWDAPLYTPVISDFCTWRNGEESVLKVYGKSKNENVLHDGKTWVKSVKDILKECGKYTEPAEEREEL